VFAQPKDLSYYDGFNDFLAREVPDSAVRIVEVGCARGRLGSELKHRVPGRHVIGIEIDDDALAVARTRLDEVHKCDLATDFPDIAPASIDCVIFGDVLEHLLDPERVLTRARELLTDDGVILICVPNFTHHSIVKALLRADPMYQPSGLLDATHIRFFSHATFIKMLLDVGLLPDLVNTINSGGTDHMIPAATPLLEYFGVDPQRALKYLDAYQYIFRATKLADVDLEAPCDPITFVACVNDLDQLNSNLLRSPCLQPDRGHQLLTYEGMTSAGAGLARGLAEARNPVVVLVQQDMYLPCGWDRRFSDQWSAAERRWGEIGVAGLFGLRFRDTEPGAEARTGSDAEPTHVGRFVDRDALLDMKVALPARVDVIDEVLLAIRSDTRLAADPGLKFHLYGADLCLRAERAGLTNVILDAPAYHNSLFAHVDASFYEATQRLLSLWPQVRPLRTNVGRLDTMQPILPPDVASNTTPVAEDETHQRLRRAESELSAIKGTRMWRARELILRTLGRL